MHVPHGCCASHPLWIVPHVRPCATHVVVGVQPTVTHRPLSHTLPPVHVPHGTVTPLQPVARSPHSCPFPAHVSGWHTHVRGAPPPPPLQLNWPEQLPHWNDPPHPSGVEPHWCPGVVHACANVFATHTHVP